MRINCRDGRKLIPIILLLTFILILVVFIVTNQVQIENILKNSNENLEAKENVIPNENVINLEVILNSSKDSLGELDTNIKAAFNKGDNTELKNILTSEVYSKINLSLNDEPIGLEVVESNEGHLLIMGKINGVQEVIQSISSKNSSDEIESLDKTIKRTLSGIVYTDYISKHGEKIKIKRIHLESNRLELYNENDRILAVYSVDISNSIINLEVVGKINK